MMVLIKFKLFLPLLILSIFIKYGYAIDNLISEQYSIVIDAGSTGSRAFVFKSEIYASGKRMVTSKGCGKVRNGLSTYNNNPNAAID